MARRTKSQKRIKEFTILAAILIISILLWETVIIFPIKMIVVFLHESSHALAAYLTGGFVEQMDVGFDLGGMCKISGGNSILVASAGYLGSFAFGLLFFYSAYSKKYGNAIVIGISVIIILFAVNLVSNPTIQILAILFSIFLLLSIRYLPKDYKNYILKSLGLISCIYVVYDIRNDLFNNGYVQSDASVIANLTGIPVVFWGILWLAVSITGLILILRFIYKKGSLG